MSEVNRTDIQPPAPLGDFIRLRANALDDHREKRHKGFLWGVAGSLATAATVYTAYKGWTGGVVAGETFVSAASIVTSVEHYANSIASAKEAAVYKSRIIEYDAAGEGLNAIAAISE